MQFGSCQRSSSGRPVILVLHGLPIPMTPAMARKWPFPSTSISPSRGKDNDITRGASLPVWNPLAEAFRPVVATTKIYRIGCYRKLGDGGTDSSLESFPQFFRSCPRNMNVLPRVEVEVPYTVLTARENDRNI